MGQLTRHAVAMFFALTLLPLTPQAAGPVGADSPARWVYEVISAEPLSLRLDPQATLEIVARRMGVELDPGIPAPAIRFESVTTLERFQDATERQWGFRPERFVNAFVAHTNEIYLIDDPAYYAAAGRTMDDTLAHELVHYVQARYGRANLSDWAECEAVEIQAWFRAEYLGSLAAQLARAPD
jgi:hypothetical protein